MNKLTQFKSAEQYVAPKIKLHALEVEGVLCDSYDTANYGYYDNELGEI